MSRFNPLLYFDTPQAVIDNLIEFAKNELAIVRLILFGSRVSGCRRPKSKQAIVPDLDVAYELDESFCEKIGEFPTLTASRISNAFKSLIFDTELVIDLQYLAQGMKIHSYVEKASLVIFDRSKL